jgi:hypothetical protein
MPDRATTPATDAVDAVPIDGDIHQFVEQWAAAWSSMALDRVAKMWDVEAPRVSYIAEELGEVLRTPDAVEEHLLRTEERIGPSKVEVEELAVTPIGSDLVVVDFVCRWQLQWVSHSRIAAVLRRRADGWSFVHYMEAPYHKEPSA